MTLLIQRVLKATVKTKTHQSSIDQGLCVYVSFHPNDTPAELFKMAQKVTKLRIFDDADGKLNLSLKEIQGRLLVVPNFTLEADATKSHRPSFSGAKAFLDAENDFQLFVDLCAQEVPTHPGYFGADMTVETINDGPVNILLRSDYGLSN